MNKIILKTATAGSVIFTFLSTLLPNSAQALFLGQPDPDNFSFNFTLDTSVPVSDKEIGVFPKTIESFMLFDTFGDKQGAVPSSKRRNLTLKVTPQKVGDGLVNECDLPGEENCFKIENGTIYKYSFEFLNQPLERGDIKNNPEYCADLDDSRTCLEGLNRVSWFVPSVFTYQASNDKSFSINRDDCLFILNNSLKCLEQIFKLAADKDIKEVIFTSKYDPENMDKLDDKIKFQTTSIPESGTSKGFLALGFLGIVTLLKRKIK